MFLADVPGGGAGSQVRELTVPPSVWKREDRPTRRHLTPGFRGQAASSVLSFRPSLG